MQGALNVTHQMAEQSRLAEKMANETNSVLADAERHRKNTENLLAKNSATVNEAQDRSLASIERMNERITGLENEIPGLNLGMCGDNVTECSGVCGGAGCGTCGGISCEAGAVTKASQALDVAKRQAEKIRNHKDTAESLLRKVGMRMFKIIRKD